MNNLKVESVKAEKQLVFDQNKVTTVERIIADLEEKLRLAIEERVNYLNRIKESEDFLALAISRIPEINAQIIDL